MLDRRVLIDSIAGITIGVLAAAVIARGIYLILALEPDTMPPATIAAVPAAPPLAMDPPAAAQMDTRELPATEPSESEPEGPEPAATLAEWHKRVAVHIHRHKPPGEKVKGTVVILFTVDRGGKVLESRVSSSSGKDALDRAALAMIQKASPMPAPPEDVEGGEFPFNVPVNFR